MGHLLRGRLCCCWCGDKIKRTCLENKRLLAMVRQRERRSIYSLDTVTAATVSATSSSVVRSSLINVVSAESAQRVKGNQQRKCMYKSMQELFASNAIVLFQLSRPKEFGFKVRRECMQNGWCMQIEEHGCQLTRDGEIRYAVWDSSYRIEFQNFFARQNSREFMWNVLASSVSI